MQRTVEQWAAQLGTNPHLLAGAMHHNDWLPGQEMDQADYEAGIASFAGHPRGVGSPQLHPAAAKRVLAHVAQIEARHRSEIKAAQLAGVRPQHQLTAQDRQAIRAAAKGN